MARLGSLTGLLAVLLAACSPARPDSVQVDVVEPPVAADSYSVLTDDRLLVEGAASWETVTVGDLVRRAAVGEEERQRAERTLASGAYLGDPAVVLRLTPAGATDRFKSGVAYLTDAFPRDRPPGAFESFVTFELSGEPGATAGLTLEIRDHARDHAAEPTGDVGQLLVTLMDPGVGNAPELTVSTREPGPTAQFEPVGGVSLDARDWRGAHRLGLSYTPGQLIVSLDAEPLVVAEVRLDRPAGPVYLGAFAPTPTMGVVLLDWTFLPR